MTPDFAATHTLALAVGWLCTVGAAAGWGYGQGRRRIDSRTYALGRADGLAGCYRRPCATDLDVGPVRVRSTPQEMV